MNKKATWWKATVEIISYGTEGYMEAIILDGAQDCAEDISIHIVSIEDMEEKEA